MRFACIPACIGVIRPDRGSRSVEIAGRPVRFAGLGAPLTAYRPLRPCKLRCIMASSRDISCLLDIMAVLRTPGSGCPWDLEQDFRTIAPYTIEEAYEVADAIARGDLQDLREELGDLLLQVVFHARMAEEQGAFDFKDVVKTLIEKLVRRHPHVFGGAQGLTAAGVEGLWEQIKTAERAQKATK